MSHPTDLPWREAIIKVLRDRGSAMHYAEIAEAITEGGLRRNFGATPARTVNSNISREINEKGEDSVFVRVRRGEFILRENPGVPPVASAAGIADESEEIGDEIESTGIVEALGMYWRRDQIVWNASPSILGQQDRKSEPVNFAGQVGVYLLHDGREVVYVGRSVKRPIGLRLYEHTYDRLNGRWDRFSWFGLLAVSEDGSLATDPSLNVDVSLLIATLEAILIEALEPRQNRKRGDDFRAVEYIQVVDPALKKQRMSEALQEMIRSAL